MAAECRRLAQLDSSTTGLHLIDASPDPEEHNKEENKGSDQVGKSKKKV